ncbi:hypothetical protein DPMN_026278 [Dreissena polymorpha]|uniref:Uncharacterized protein n=1 Tax=Dreissena polymorpha TaxID=45954 RepID=A0A9D4RE49_DREPO|nr:hypothetical protein DPMN_026278 [Dreissena polymorpha]
MGVGIETQNQFESGSHFRVSKFPSRSRYRISPPEWSLNSSVIWKMFNRWGQPQLDLFATLENKKNSSVLLMASPPASICSRCSVNNVAEHVCVCISANSVVTQSSDSFTTTVSVYNDLDCPFMTETTVVSDIIESVDSMPNQIVSPERLVNSMQGSGQSSRTGGSGVDCMAVIDRGFSTKEFSKDT